MAEIIAVVSGKGGVGKTTAAANLGVALAAMGKRVLLIDGDIGLRNLDVVLGMQNNVVFDFLDVIEGRCDLRKAIITYDKFSGLKLLSAPQTADNIKIARDDIKNLIEKLRVYYDYIFIDCPAGIDEGFEIMASCADMALVISTPEIISIRDADRVVAKLEKLNIEKSFLIINKIRVDMIKKGDMIDIDNIINVVAIPLIGAIPDDLSVITANNKGCPVILKSKSRVGKAYYNIAKRLTGEKVPILEDEKKGIVRFFSLIFR